MSARHRTPAEALAPESSQQQTVAAEHKPCVPMFGWGMGRDVSQ